MARRKGFEPRVGAARETPSNIFLIVAAFVKAALNLNSAFDMEGVNRIELLARPPGGIGSSTLNGKWRSFWRAVRSPFRRVTVTSLV